MAAIAGFIAIVVKAYKENETFRNIVNSVMTGIKNIIKSTFDFIKTIFSGIVTVVRSNLNTAKTVVSNIFKLIKSIITGDLSGAKAAIGNIFGAIVSNIRTKLNTAKTVVKAAINAIKGFFNFKWSLPPLKLPSIDISGKFSLNPPSAPKFSINWNALGGVFDKPTLFGYGGSLQGLGEDGAEAVVPLEKNTQWLDKLADKLAAKQNGIPIILQVDGKTFAQVSIDSINALTKQRGTLGLNLL